MTGHFLISGNLDLAGGLFILLVVLCSVAGFLFVLVFVCAKVFGRRGAGVMTINAGRDEEGRR